MNHPLWLIVIGVGVMAFGVLWVWAMQFSSMFDDAPDPYEESDEETTRWFKTLLAEDARPPLSHEEYDEEALARFLEDREDRLHTKLISAEDSPIDRTNKLP